MNFRFCGPSSGVFLIAVANLVLGICRLSFLLAIHACGCVRIEIYVCINCIKAHCLALGLTGKMALEAWPCMQPHWRGNYTSIPDSTSSRSRQMLMSVYPSIDVLSATRSSLVTKMRLNVQHGSKTLSVKLDPDATTSRNVIEDTLDRGTSTWS